MSSSGISECAGCARMSTNGTISNLRALRGPKILFAYFQVFINFCLLLYFYYSIMITYYVVKNLVLFAICDCDYWHVLTYLDFQHKDKKWHWNDKSQIAYCEMKEKPQSKCKRRLPVKMLRPLIRR